MGRHGIQILYKITKLFRKYCIAENECFPTIICFDWGGILLRIKTKLIEINSYRYNSLARAQKVKWKIHENHRQISGGCDGGDGDGGGGGGYHVNSYKHPGGGTLVKILN